MISTEGEMATCDFETERLEIAAQGGYMYPFYAMDDLLMELAQDEIEAERLAEGSLYNGVEFEILTDGDWDDGED